MTESRVFRLPEGVDASAVGKGDCRSACLGSTVPVQRL
jgi:hypothetical protein